MGADLGIVHYWRKRVQRALTTPNGGSNDPAVLPFLLDFSHFNLDYSIAESEYLDICRRTGTPVNGMDGMYPVLQRNLVLAGQALVGALEHYNTKGNGNA